MVAGLPRGYRTRVGERGRALSAGQRQLLALARAELVDPDVLLFDEATASLDLATEAAVTRAADAVTRRRTTLVVAHRLTTAARADRVAVLAHGRLVELGTHDELLAAGGAYAELWAAFTADQDADPLWPSAARVHPGRPGPAPARRAPLRPARLAADGGAHPAPVRDRDMRSGSTVGRRARTSYPVTSDTPVGGRSGASTGAPRSEHQVMTTIPYEPAGRLLGPGSATALRTTGRARGADLQSELVALPMHEDVPATVRELPLPGLALSTSWPPSTRGTTPRSPRTGTPWAWSAVTPTRWCARCCSRWTRPPRWSTRPSTPASTCWSPTTRCCSAPSTACPPATPRAGWCTGWCAPASGCSWPTPTPTAPPTTASMTRSPPLLGLSDVRPLETVAAPQTDTLVVFAPVGVSDQLVDALAAAGAGVIGDYTRCVWQTTGTGAFIPGDGTHPAIGRRGHIERVPEIRLEMVVPRARRAEVLRALLELHPYEDPGYAFFENSATASRAGFGRVGGLHRPVTLREFADRVATALPGTPGGRADRRGPGADRAHRGRLRGQRWLAAGRRDRGGRGRLRHQRPGAPHRLRGPGRSRAGALRRGTLRLRVPVARLSRRTCCTATSWRGSRWPSRPGRTDPWTWHVGARAGRSRVGLHSAEVSVD